ncbi:MAG TPA: AMIN domain-containing protein [Geobacteraceae bacterium]|nr:AMIN domain-containing protein [Geobacteraceae bacterium]
MEENTFAVSEQNALNGLRPACYRIFLFLKVVVAACFLFPASCAPVTDYARNNRIDSEMAILDDIIVSGAGDDTKLEIVLNKPLKYSLYNIAEPPRLVVSLSPSFLNPFRTPIDIKSSLVSRIDIIKENNDESRIIFRLKRHVVFTVNKEQNDGNKIIMSVVKTAVTPVAPVKEKAETPSQTRQTEQTNAAISPQPMRNISSAAAKSVNPSVTVTTSSSSHSKQLEPKILKFEPPVWNSEKDHVGITEQGEDGASLVFRRVDVDQRGITILLSGIGSNYRFFELEDPKRLVFDVFGAHNVIENKIVQIKKLGIARVRLGAYPDKIRIVIDASGKIFPKYRFEVDNQGIKVFFDD